MSASRHLCSVCKQPVVEGQKVVRVERVVLSAAGTLSTTGWASEDQEFIHLGHIIKAALR